MGLTWLALRARWRGAWARSLAVALLIGAVGGFILAAAASGRGVEDTYQTLIGEIGAPDLAVVPCERPAEGVGCVAALEPVSGEVVVEGLESLAPVERARLIEPVAPYFVDAEGQPLLATANDPYGCYDDDRSVPLVALAPGGAADQAMPFRLDGELPVEGSSGVVLTLATAERVGLDVGDRLRLAGWCSGEGDPGLLVQPVDLAVSGLSVGPLDIEPPDTGIAIEPAYVDHLVVERLISAGAEPQSLNVTVWLDPRASPEAVSEALKSYEIVIDLRARAAVFDDTLATDARLLWLLAGVGAVGAVLLLAPILGRNVQDTARDTTTLVALGSSHRQMTVHAIVHVGVLALIGALLAAVFAPLISALLPPGFAAAIVPARRLWFDPLVTIVGALLLVCAVIAMGALPAWRSASPRQADAGKMVTRRRSMVSLSRLGPAAHSGVLTAVGTPAGPRQASPWPSLVSLAIAGATCAGSLTYLAGLSHFERTPWLVGWNWDAAVGFDDDAAEAVPSIRDRLAQIDGVDVVTAGTIYPPALLIVPDSDIFVWPWSFATGPQAITPSMLTGRAPDGPDEVAINEIFAESSGLVVGDSVSLARPTLVTAMADEIQQTVTDSDVGNLGLERPDEQPVVATFEITGLAVLPLERTQEFAQAAFTLDGLAALVEPSEDEVVAARKWLPDSLPAELRAEADDFLSNTGIDDRSVYMRFSGDLHSTAEAIGRIEGVADVIAPTPEQVLTEGIALNLASSHGVPNALVIVVSSAAAAVLAYLLVTAVRARRFEFAVMRALGLTSRGIRRSIGAQAAATSVIPLMAGIPLGISVGRWAWLQQAGELDVIPQALTPWPALAILVVAAILIASLAALIPEWMATKRSPGDNLRVE